MTRINCIPPSELTRQHLIAEYRELPRIFGLVRAAQDRDETPTSIQKRAPQDYRLGTGHVLFFYTRLTWISNRYIALVQEMLNRGYKPGYPTVNSLGIRPEWFNDWSPQEYEMQRNRDRIADRLNGV